MNHSLPSRPATLITVVVLICSLIGVLSVSAPEVQPLTASETQFSAERALTYLEPIAQQPRAVGTNGHLIARDFIVLQLRNLGLEVEVQTEDVSNYFAGKIHGARVHNILARKPGTAHTGTVVLAAHYDSVPNSPGGNDDGAGVATLIETARALNAGPKLKNDVLFLFTDAEEVGLVGATAFTFKEDRAQDISVLLNFEARGSGGPSAMFEAVGKNAALIKAFAEVAPHPVGNSLVASLSKLLPNDTDMSIFRMGGIRGLNFAYADRLHHYHTPLDNTRNLQLKSLQHHGSYALALTRHFGDRDLMGLHVESDRIYFDFLSLFVIHYPSSLSYGLSLLAAAAALWLFRRFRKAPDQVSALISATISYVAILILNMAIATGLMFLIRWVVPTNQLMAHNRWIFLCLLAIGLSVTFFILRKIRMSPGALSGGSLMVWSVPAVFTGLLAPGTSYLFQWPFLFATGAFLLLTRRHFTGRHTALATALLIPIGLWLGHTTYTVLILDGGLTPALPLLFFLYFLGPLLLPLLSLPFWIQRRLLPTIGGLGCIGLVVAGVLFQPSAELPKPHSLVFGIDTDTLKAWWFTHDPKPDEWTSVALGPSPHRSRLNGLLTSEKKVLSQTTPFLPIPPPTLEFVAESTQNGDRTLVVFARSPRKAACFTIWEDSETIVRSTRINDREPIIMARFSPVLDAKLWKLATGDQTASDWKMTFCGLGSDPLKITLTVDAGRPLRLRIVDETYELPTAPSVVLPQRPPHLMPNRSSDRTLVGAKFDI